MRSQATRHKIGSRTIILDGGPHELAICTGDDMADEIRFPAERTVNYDGTQSICAPQPTDNGPIVYRNTRKRNLFGAMVFRYDSESQ